MENLAYILAAVALLFEGKKALKRLAVLTWYNQFQKSEFEAKKTLSNTPYENRGLASRNATTISKG